MNLLALTMSCWTALGTAATATTPGELSRLIELAKPGETINVPAGVYLEHIRIDKPLTLEGGWNAVIDGGGSGDIVEIAAAGVTLRGFTIRNTGVDLDKENAAVRVLAPRAVIEHNTLDDVLFGIDFREAPDGVIRGNRIGGKDLDLARRGDGLRLWRSDRAVIEGNTLHDGRDAIIWYSSGVSVRGNVAEACRYGLHLMYSDSVVIEGNTLRGNSVGVYLMYSAGIELRNNRLIRNRGPSGYGIGLKEADRYTIRDNLLAGNRVGVYVDGSPFGTTMPGVFTRNTIACNDAGFTLLPSARGNEVYENNLIDNLDQVCVAGRGPLTGNAFWKGDRGNFWSDYTGYDHDGDGIGDFVHEPTTLFDNLIERDPRLRLFLYGPAQQAVEFVGRALPAVRPEPKFTDEVPLIRPVRTAIDEEPQRTSRWPLVACALGLVAAGAGLVLVGRHTGARA